MAEQDLDNLKRKCDQHDDELSEQQTQIVNLERKLSELTETVKNLSVVCATVQRYTEEQEKAYKAIEERLTSMMNPTE